nr:hypothetical protein [Mycobacterium uberis]
MKALLMFGKLFQHNGAAATIMAYTTLEKFGIGGQQGTHRRQHHLNL